MTGRGAVIRRNPDWHGSTAVVTAAAVAGGFAIATRLDRDRRARLRATVVGSRSCAMPSVSICA